MSSLRMFTIDNQGDLHEFAVFGNSWLGWSYFWEWMESQYFPIQPGNFSIFIDVLFQRNENEREETMRKFWDLAIDKRVSKDRRIVMRCTYTGAMLKREHCSMAASAFRQVALEMTWPWIVRGGHDRVSTRDTCGHLDALALKIDEAGRLDDIIGVCWQGTTVDADAWGCEGVVFETDDGPSRPFNIFKDKNHGHQQYWIDPENVYGDGPVIEID